MLRKLPLLFTTFLLIGISVKGQIRFNKRIVTDTLPKVITSIYPTDSCYYGIGIVSDTINLLSFGNSFYKFDLEGNIIFEKRISEATKTFELWEQLKENGQGELVSIGYTKDTSAISWKSLFVKFNLNGDTLVTKEHISPNFDLTGDPFYSPLDFLQTLDGGYIFAANTANTEKDIAITKLDQDGNQVWSKTYGNPYGDVIRHIIRDEDKYIVCGSTNLNGLGSTAAINSLYLLCVDEDGNELWSFVAPEEYQIGTATDIVKCNDGGLIISSSIKTGIVNNNNYYVGSVLKLNSNFELEWHNPIYHQPASSINFLYEIVEREIDDAFTVMGIQYGFNDTTWGFQPWLAKVSVDGDSLWSRDYTFLGLSPHMRHQFIDVRKTYDDGYIMCGESIDLSPDGSGDGQKGWLIKVDEYGCLVPGCHLGTSIENPKEVLPFVIKTYPNPTSDYLNVYFKHKEIKRDGIFRLVDINGRVVLEFNVNKNDTTYIIDVGQYTNGVYFLQYLQDGIPESTNQIVIQK